MKQAIEFQNVCAAYDFPLFVDFCYSFPAEGRYFLLGPSGCGKTTLLRLLAGLVKPESGKIEGLQKKRISYVFQEDRLFLHLTALENVLLVCPEQERCRFLLRELGLSEAEDKKPSALSGGMRKRVSLARALAYDGDVFLFDEAFSALDMELRQQITPLIKQATANKLSIFVTHDEREAAYFSAETLFAEGPPFSIRQGNFSCKFS